MIFLCCSPVKQLKPATNWKFNFIAYQKSIDSLQYQNMIFIFTKYVDIDRNFGNNLCVIS